MHFVLDLSSKRAWLRGSLFWADIPFVAPFLIDTPSQCVVVKINQSYKPIAGRGSH